MIAVQDPSFCHQNNFQEGYQRKKIPPENQGEGKQLKTNQVGKVEPF
jgi:hypothetical protein